MSDSGDVTLTKTGVEILKNKKGRNIEHHFCFKMAEYTGESSTTDRHPPVIHNILLLCTTHE
jgi:hypothetical protein